MSADKHSLNQLLKDIASGRAAPLSDAAVSDVFRSRVARIDKVLAWLGGDPTAMGASDFVDYVFVSKAWHYIEAGTTDVDALVFDGWTQRGAIKAMCTMYRIRLQRDVGDCEFEARVKYVADRNIRHDNRMLKAAA